jgi:HEAT repeat protein
MKRRYLGWLVIVVLGLLGLGVVVPSSPIYLPKWYGPGPQYDSKPMSHWVKLLDSEDPEEKRAGIFALGAIGPDAGEHVPTLAKFMTEDPDRRTRTSASFALSKMAPASRAAVPALIQGLADEEPAVRMNAAMALFRLKGDSRPAAAALTKALQDPANDTNLNVYTFTIQQMSAMALGRATAGTDEAVPTLTAALDKATGTDIKSANQRAALARGLGEVGPPAKSTLPRLRELLKERDPAVRDAVTFALEAIEGVPPEPDKK